MKRPRSPRRLAVNQMPGGVVEIVEEDGVVLAESEIKHQRILAALRKGNGRAMYVHMRPR